MADKEKIKVEITPLEEVSKSSLEMRLGVVKEFPLVVTNLPAFQDTVRADLDSVMNYIMIKEGQIADMQEKLDKLVNSDKVKSEGPWEGDIWYEFYNKQKEIDELHLDLSVIKTYLIQYLILVVEKLSQMANTFRKEFVEMQKLQAEKDMVDKLMDRMDKEKEMWLKSYNENIQMRFDGVNKLFDGLMKRIADVEAQMKLVVAKFNEVERKVENVRKNLESKAKEVSEGEEVESE
jgi:hypothetical protein